jgi:hypothetical protein
VPEAPAVAERRRPDQVAFGVEEVGSRSEIRKEEEVVSQLIETPEAGEIREYTQVKSIWIELSGETRDPFKLG